MWRSALAAAAGLAVFAILGGALGALRMALVESHGMAWDAYVGIAHIAVSMLGSGFVMGLISKRKHLIAPVTAFVILLAVWAILVFRAFPQIWVEASTRDKRLMAPYAAASLLPLAVGAWLGVKANRKLALRRR